MENFILYNASQSTCSQRVRYALHAKKITFEDKKLDLFSGDQLAPEYLKINLNGVVPALVHRGESITDSAVILEYLEETQTAHLSWSSQARGFFLPEEITQKIEDKITSDESSWRKPGEHSSGPLSCYDDADNRERK